MEAKVDRDIDVIILEIQSGNSDYSHFEQLSAKNKIDSLYQLINDIMLGLNQDENNTNTLKLFICREYAIFDPDSRFCKFETRQYLKEKMTELAVKYSIGIIPGSLSTKKKVDVFTKEKYEDIKSRYTNHPDELKSQMEYKFHFNKLERLWHFSREKGSSLVIIQNTAYFFYPNHLSKKPLSSQKNTKGELLHYFKHHKSQPYEETMESDGHLIGNAFYCPGKAMSAKPVMTIIHPFLGHQITIGLEICYEHNRGYLKNYIQKKADEHKNIALDLHIVISATVNLDKNNLLGGFSIQADSAEDPAPICWYEPSFQPQRSKPIFFYTVNATGQTENELILQKLPVLHAINHPFEALISACSTEVLIDLLNKVPIKFSDNFSRSLLHSAVLSNSINFVDYFCTKGGDINAKDEKGNTALHYCVQDTLKFEMASKLLSKDNINPNEVNNKGLSPLHCLIIRNDFKSNESQCMAMLTLLLKHGSNPNITNPKIYSAFYTCVSRGHIKAVVLMLDDTLKYRAEVNLIVGGYELFKTPLMIALIFRNFEMATILLNHGADINQKINKKGDNFLHLFIEEGSKEIVLFLIKKGIAIEAIKKAYHYAKKINHSIFMDLLSEYTDRETPFFAQNSNALFHHKECSKPTDSSSLISSNPK